jgi:hypothetical protein
MLKVRKALKLTYAHLVTTKVTALVDAGRGWNCLCGETKEFQETNHPC